MIGRTQARARRWILAVLLLGVAVVAPAPASGLTVKLTITSHIGAGAARLTVFTAGTGSIYVNLKGLTPGIWSEQLLAGTCSKPGQRLAVLPGLIVPASRHVARTNTLTARQAGARVLRLARGSTVLCTTFASVSSPQDGKGSADPAGRYVSATGSDANPGTLSSPWRTMQRAADSAGPGTTVIVLPGTYPAFVIRRSGTPTAPIVFKSSGAPKPQIVGNGSRTVIDVVGAHDVTISGFEITGAAGPRETGAGVRVEGGSHDIRILNNSIHDNTTQGVHLDNVTSVTVSGNDVHHNQLGIQVTGQGDGILITDNTVHQNDRMVVNTPTPGDDYGGVGITLVRSTGAVTVSKNRVWGNRAPSDDYVWDGGAFEIFGASNATFRENITWDNENIVETGTDGAECRNNVFARNVSFGAVTAGRTYGMFLRCAENMLVANNTIVDLNSFVFAIGPLTDPFAGSVDGLRIVNNIAVTSVGKIYGVEMALPSTVVIERNLVHNAGGGELATVTGKGSTRSSSQLRSWIGQSVADIDADPRFVDAQALNFTLAAGSPAIDAGEDVAGITTNFVGSAPDIGRFESSGSGQ